MVETFEQEQQLMDKQEKLMEQDRMNAKESLDEPSLIICLLIIVVAVVGFMMKRNRKVEIDK